MGTKNNPGKFDCYRNAEPDEPMFILLARDSSAPQLIEYWAVIREREILDGIKPQSDMAIIEEARKCAQVMREWRRENRP